jgi:Flp pilus assembly protein TadB
MSTDSALIATCMLMAGLISLPALQAWQRRRSSREASGVAVELTEFADAVRRDQRCLPLDAALLSRAQRLHIPELVSFLFAQELARPNPQLLAETAQRLALRLKRRVAFERKMLARTASGRRRGAAAAALPALVLLGMALTGQDIPQGALLLLLALEAAGCWLLWRVARIEI